MHDCKSTPTPFVLLAVQMTMIESVQQEEQDSLAIY